MMDDKQRIKELERKLRIQITVNKDMSESYEKRIKELEVSTIHAKWVSAMERIKELEAQRDKVRQWLIAILRVQIFHKIIVDKGEEYSIEVFDAEQVRTLVNKALDRSK